jgi:glycosyltransferase involved in cell wall biosynthesis
MTAPLTIVVDLRVAQFDEDRGIAAYSQSLALQLARGHAVHRWLFLHDAERPSPTRSGELAAHGTWQTSRQLEAARSLRIDAILTGGFFPPHHRCNADYLLPPWLRLQRPRRLGIVYDLVPWIFQDRYLARKRSRAWYHELLGVLRGSDHLFGISRSTCHDTVRYAGVDPRRVHCIDGDIDQRKRALMLLPAAETASLPARHGLVGPYCACIGGADWRKNLDVMVGAFAEFHRDHPDHQLAIVCKLADGRITELRHLAASHGLPDRAVVCTGYVSDADLVGIMQHARMLVYPSIYEGLGLPVLEAYGCGVPVVGSANSSIGALVIPELAVDPTDPAAIARAMRRLVVAPSLAKASLAHGGRLLAGLGWSRAADTIMHQVAGPSRPATPATRAAPATRGRLAVVAALPPARTAIAGYTVRHLQPPRWKTDFFDANPGLQTASPAGLRASSRVLPVEALRPALQRGLHATVIHVLGNSPHHVKVLEAMMRSRDATGTRRIAYLHEANLSIAFHAWLGDDFRRLPAVEASTTPAAAWIDRAIATLPDMGRCLRFLAERADLHGLIVNSSACRELVRAAVGSLAERWTIDVAHLPVEPAGPSVAASRPGPHEPHATGRRPLMVGSFGITGDGKRLDCLARAVALLARRRPARLVIAGWDAARYSRRTGLDALPCVEVHDAPDDARLAELMQATDVAVQLRESTHGESSAAVGQLLALGRQLVVTNEGSFAELPRELVTFVPATCPPATLADAIETAAGRSLDDADLAAILAKLSPEAFTARLEAILAAA